MEETLTQFAMRKSMEQKGVAEMAKQTMLEAKDDEEFRKAAEARYQAELHSARWEEVA